MTLQDQSIAGLGQAPVEVLNSTARGPVLLVCEHASKFFPPQFGSLGLTEDTLQSHIAWDPGALAVAKNMSGLLDAKLVAGTVSRLIYDCNRPPEAEGAMSVQSEVFAVPGNVDLTDQQRQMRVDQIYCPFTKVLDDTISQAASPPVLVTIHSFTKNYMGADRAVEVGILHDTDSRLADAMLALAPAYMGLRVERNQPYGPEDGVTHTLRLHGLPNGLMNVMIEVRNDLLISEAAQKDIAAMLSSLIDAALAKIAQGEGV